MGGRRRHPKVEDFPPEIVSEINDTIVNKRPGRKTYKEMEDWLKADGYDISDSSLQRYGKNFLAKLERIKTACEQAKTILETSSGLKTDMAEATSTVAFQLLMEVLINTDAEKVDNTTLNAIKALAMLERSTVSREKLKLEYDKGVNAAVEQFDDRFSKGMSNHPEFLIQMKEILETMKKPNG